VVKRSQEVAKELPAQFKKDDINTSDDEDDNDDDSPAD
jgi:hypothetical protein